MDGSARERMPQEVDQRSVTLDETVTDLGQHGRHRPCKHHLVRQCLFAIDEQAFAVEGFAWHSPTHSIPNSAGTRTGPPAGGEELAVMRQVLEHAPGWWVPDATLEHCIDAPRQSEAYLFAYYRTAGSVSARRLQHARLSRRLIVITWSLARWLRHQIEYLACKWQPGRGRRAYNIRQIAWHGSHAMACLRGMFQP